MKDKDVMLGYGSPYLRILKDNKDCEIKQVNEAMLSVEEELFISDGFYQKYWGDGSSFADKLGKLLKEFPQDVDKFRKLMKKYPGYRSWPNDKAVKDFEKSFKETQKIIDNFKKDMWKNFKKYPDGSDYDIDWKKF